jgi:hypothetical protein
LASVLGGAGHQRDQSFEEPARALEGVEICECTDVFGSETGLVSNEKLPAIQMIQNPFLYFTWIGICQGGHNQLHHCKPTDNGTKKSHGTKSKRNYPKNKSFHVDRTMSAG